MLGRGLDPPRTTYLSAGSRPTARGRPMLTERFFRRPLARAQAPVGSYLKGEVMERLLGLLNDVAW
jgi:hypothetical protein